MKNELIAMLCAKSFQYSKKPVFKLVSGQRSCFYINCKPTTLSPRGMFLAGHLIYEALKGENADGVGGLTFGADPLAVATAFVSELKGAPIKAFSIRKEKKKHGTSQWIEGEMKEGERVVILDDVATTGGSTIKAIDRAEFEGLEVIKAVVLVDRQEGGLQNISSRAPHVSAIVNIEELLSKYQQMTSVRI